MKKLLVAILSLAFLLSATNITTEAAASTYTVKSGDTLYGIAKKHKLTITQLKSMNKLKSDTIKPKQVLKVAVVKAAAKPAVKTAATKPAVSKVLNMTATAYTASCKSCSGITATGMNLKKNPNLKVISVDPKVIPLGTKVYVEGYGYAIAADKGSAVKGNKIDVFIPNKQRALNWGKKTVKVTVYK
ncbi:3D domain-containing protein [Peribacillus alkalitolerans]|uniref:3D domain-containing protein n=1 Tax=Peribacillus alkalitolerans TaxID=1550385 RepID=UPI0013D81EBF|nr:3D domain-containing protein [Peribacillus alkalitolerans]